MKRRGVVVPFKFGQRKEFNVIRFPNVRKLVLEAPLSPSDKDSNLVPLSQVDATGSPKRMPDDRMMNMTPAPGPDRK